MSYVESQISNLLRYGGSSYGGGGGRGAATAAAGGYHAGSSPGPADLYAAATEYVQQATSPQPQSNGYQLQMNRVSLRRQMYRVEVFYWIRNHRKTKYPSPDPYPSWNHNTSIGVVIPLLTGCKSESGITKKLKIRLMIRIQGRNHVTLLVPLGLA